MPGTPPPRDVSDRMAAHLDTKAERVKAAPVVSKAEKEAAEFLQENQLDNRDKYQTQAVWCAVEYL